VQLFLARTKDTNALSFLSVERGVLRLPQEISLKSKHAMKRSSLGFYLWKTTFVRLARVLWSFGAELRRNRLASRLRCNQIAMKPAENIVGHRR